MSRKTPKNTEEIFSPIQLQAIDLIMSGGKYTEIARFRFRFRVDTV